METKNIILKLRTERGMSQDELADKIMVTRQAVSRWENGDTVPNTDTLRLLSKEFDVIAIAISGETERELKISHYLQLKNTNEAHHIFKDDKFLSISDYLDGYKTDERKCTGNLPSDRALTVGE